MASAIVARDQGRARLVVEAMTRAFLGHAARRRQGIDRGNGARSPAGLAQPRRSLGEISDPSYVEYQSQTGRGMMRMRTGETMTPVGYKTARGALPPVLAMLEPGDPRLRAALMFADAIERVGAVGGVDLGGGDIKGGVSDGGATTRVKHAARFNRVRDAVNGWQLDPIAGRVIRGRERVVLRVQRRRGKAKDITAMALLWAVCVEGQDMAEILRAHGWSAHSTQRKALAEAMLELLDLARDAMGGAR